MAFINFRRKTVQKNSVYGLFTAKNGRKVDKIVYFPRIAYTENVVTFDGIVMSKQMET